MQNQFGGNGELSGPELFAVLAFYGFILVVIIAIQILICGSSTNEVRGLEIDDYPMRANLARWSA